MTKTLPPQEVLLVIFDYDAATGKLIRKALRSEHFKATDDPRGTEWLANHYNSQNAGAEAFTYADRRGYLKGRVLGTACQAHRVIWKMVHGTEPVTVDHINGNPSDNRLSNLRAATVAENSRNYRKPGGGSSIYRGVYWVKRDAKFAARISYGKGGKRSLGNFADEVEAARAYDRAARDLHGAFAVLNFPDEVQP